MLIYHNNPISPDICFAFLMECWKLYFFSALQAILWNVIAKLGEISVTRYSLFHVSNTSQSEAVLQKAYRKELDSIPYVIITSIDVAVSLLEHVRIRNRRIFNDSNYSKMV